MYAIKLKDVKSGEFIMRKPDAKKVYTKGDYDKTYKKYSCEDWEDISRNLLLKGETIVYTGFEF